MRRTPRAIAAFFLALIPSALGAIVALLYTSAGTSLLGRVVSGELSKLFRGQFEVQRISGTFIRSLVLDSLVIHDSTGAVFAKVPQIRVTYALPNLLAGRIVFGSVQMDQPEIHIVKRSTGRINFQEIFKLGEGPPGTGRSPLVELRNVAIDSGSLDVQLNWNPPDSARTPAQVQAVLAAERAQPGRAILETRDGYKRQLTLIPLTARLPLVRISTPDNAPLTFDIDSLATNLSDPAIPIRDLKAHAWTRGDTLAFTLHRAALPNTEAIGGGVVTWPDGPMLYDFTLDASRFDLNDLRWISPDFPEMTGQTQVTARSRSATRNAYALSGLQASGPKGRVNGSVIVITDATRGLGVEEMNLRVTALDLDVPRAYLDTIPLQGTLTGTVTGDGFLDRLTVDADLTFSDALVPGGANSRIELRGALVGGGAEGIAFDGVALDSVDLDLRTIQLITPAVALKGRLAMVGTLQGPWKNVTFRGRLRHQDGEFPVTAAEGSARLDTRGEILKFDTDLAFAPLALEGIRPSYPNLPIRGLLHGNVLLRGSTEHFFINTALQSEAGAFTVTGTIAPGDRLMVDSLFAEFQSLDLAELRGTGPHTRLTGRLYADGTFDSLTGPEGSATIDLASGAFMDVAFDTVTAKISAANGRITVDTMAATLGMSGKIGGKGAIAWREPGRDRIELKFEVDTLDAFDSYLTRLAGPVKDTLTSDRPLSGSAKGEVQLLGAALFPRLLVQVKGQNLVWRDYESPNVSATFGWNGSDRPEIGLGLTADELTAMGITVNDVYLVGGGFQDSLRWSGKLNPSEDISVSGGGEWWTTGPSPVIAFDSLLATLPNRAWYLRKPTTVTLGKGGFDFTPVDVASTDGSGSIQVSGSLPRTEPGELKVDAFGIAMNDIYALMQRDTTGVAGTIQADLLIGGVATNPTITGTAALSDFSLGDFGSPFVQAVMNYRQQRLEATLLMWKTGQQVMRAEADLPVDLALQTVAKRTLPGPLSVRVIADSTDLSLLEAFTSTIRRVRGTMKADVAIEGTWDNPSLDGFLNLQDASAQLPSLGVTYSRIDLHTRFAGDSITVDTLQVRSGEGSLSATGGLRFGQLTQPTFNLTLNARRFRAINQSRFLTLDATGRVSLTGPVVKPKLTGRITADQGDLHFADLISKRIVDLENPEDSGLIDLDLIRTEKLGAGFQNRFLDSLQIDNLQVTMGENFWLRSSEANIQLDGNMTINKTGEQYRYDGTMNAVRGNYALKIGFVTRDFTVERGTVRYYGTPDLNAELDIEARHVVEAQTNGNEEIPVIARITGTMLQPRLELRTDATANRANLSQTELVSYLMFGRPTFSLQGPNGQGSQYAAVQATLGYLSSALSSELQRSLISDLGVPIDYLDIRPGSAGTGTISGQTGSAQVAQVAAGWQIGRKWFVEVVADLCTNTQRFYPNAEYRVTRQLKVKTSVEPAYSCNVAAAAPSAALSVNKYQIGLDVLWERDY